MSKIFLLVVFLINGEPTIIGDGFSPREQESMEVCEQRKLFFEFYLEQNSEQFPPILGVYCGTREEIEQQVIIDTSELL